MVASITCGAAPCASIHTETLEHGSSHWVLVWGKAALFVGEFAGLCKRSAWKDILDVAAAVHPTIAVAALETAIVLLTLNAVAELDSRMALRSRSLPDTLLILGKCAPGEACIERQDACNELLGTDTKMLDATS